MQEGFKMNEMSRIERMEKLFSGETLDRPPFTMFFHLAHHHFDNMPEPHIFFSDMEIRLFDTYRFDFIKVMNDFPYPMPPGIDIINTPKDLFEMTMIDLLDAPFHHQLNALEILNKELMGKKECPFWDTLFNPWFTIRRHILGDDIYTYMESHKEALHHALKVVAENSINYAVASIKRGTQAIFFSVPASSEYVTPEQYDNFMKPYDLHLLNGIRNQINDPRIILHLHGSDETYFNEVLEYQPDGISWQDQLASPSIVEARKLYDGVLMGGIDHEAINYLPLSRLKDQIITAKKQGGNKRFILAPGCVIPSHCPKRIIQFASEVALAEN